jgi:hypothetical protein
MPDAWRLGDVSNALHHDGLRMKLLFSMVGWGLDCRFAENS